MRRPGRRFTRDQEAVGGSWLSALGDGIGSLLWSVGQPVALVRVADGRVLAGNDAYGAQIGDDRLELRDRDGEPVAEGWETRRVRVRGEDCALALRRAVPAAPVPDRLTGLAGRAQLVRRIDRALRRARSCGGAIAVASVDLDGFKRINDEIGFAAGDRVLAACGRCLLQTVRPEDTVARFGGDEFVVLADPVADDAGALAFAERLRVALAAELEESGRGLVVSASIGIAVSDGIDEAPDALLRDADAAMYHAKRRGRGRFELFGAPLRDEALRRLALEQDLRRALEHEELHLEYQPVIDFATNAVVSYEALLRWTHPERGRIAPDEFIGIAEDSGLMLPMGRWVLRTACAEARRWPAGVGVGVNLSARQVADPDMCEHVRGALADTGLDPARLTLEITESTLMEEAEAPLRTLESLRAMGVRLALDDFGTGYSSLSYLRRFALDTLKVDRSFVRDLGEDPHATPLVEAVVSMASALGLDVVAEGIETEAQRSQLAALGCRYGQGYLLGRPQPAAALHQPGGAATIPA
jgi:diguanylate cyclase (GGDEF)-like protein